MFKELIQRSREKKQCSICGAVTETEQKYTHTVGRYINVCVKCSRLGVYFRNKVII